jgi:thiol-disulfide isomerase/thioredoxin
VKRPAASLGHSRAPFQPECSIFSLNLAVPETPQSPLQIQPNQAKLVSHPYSIMKTFLFPQLFARSCLIVTVFIVLLNFAPYVRGGASDSATNAPSEADKAWKELEKAMQPDMPPAEWHGHPTPEQRALFRAKQAEKAGLAAEKAKDFYTQYPSHVKAGQAKKRETDLLQVAVQLGNTNKLAEFQRLQQEKAKDPNLSEDERLKLRMDAIQTTVRAKMQEGPEAIVAELEKSGNELIKEFPKRNEGYQLLVEAASQAEGDKARSLAKEVAASDAPEESKTRAQGLLAKFEALGKPLPIKFTAIDGREVDLAKLTGKVVLVDFWATWCGPCVAELPHVKDAYDKLHGKGFEIVGISFDQDKKALEKFITEREMKWPQYFDGKGWGNEFGQKYGINGIPAMWLVDKKGNLRDMNARGALEGKVAKLLEE